MQSNSRDSRAYASELDRLIERTSHVMRALEKTHDRGGHTQRESDQLKSELNAICQARKVMHMAKFAMNSHAHDADPIVKVSAEVNTALYEAGIMIERHAGLVYREKEAVETQV